jgi:hypothetical protein
VEPVTALPVVTWRWDTETDILSGSFRPAGASTLDGTIELNDVEGAIAVLDVTNGAVSGLDVVVWPEVTTSRTLLLPTTAESGRLALAGATGTTWSFEIETPLLMRTNAAENLYHLRLGDQRVARVVRVADQLLVELDPEGALAGCWLVGVPPFPSLDD